MDALLKPTLKLSLRHAYKGGDLGETQGLFHVAFHELKGFFKLCVFSANILPQRRALALLVASPVSEKQFKYTAGQIGTSRR